MTVGVAIPSIPPRGQMLRRALGSVTRQDQLPDAIAVAVDYDHQGAHVTRNRAWRMLDTDFIAFLDDDDELLPHHLRMLTGCAVQHDADMVYSWYHVEGGTDPPSMATNFGRPWDPQHPVQTTVTCLWRRTALEKIDGFPAPAVDYDEHGNRIGEEFLAVLRLNEFGGRIVHLPEITWVWHHHWCNTSGMPSRWA